MKTTTYTAKVKPHFFNPLLRNTNNIFFHTPKTAFPWSRSSIKFLIKTQRPTSGYFTNAAETAMSIVALKPAPKD